MYTRFLFGSMALLVMGGLAESQSERGPLPPRGNTLVTVAEETARAEKELQPEAPGQFMNPFPANGNPIPKRYLWGDVDSDGLKDVFLLDSMGNYLFRNRGNGGFEDVTHLVFPNGAGRGILGFFADFNKDERTDLFLFHEEGFRLYRNEGRFRLNDVTVEMGLDPGLSGEGVQLEDFDGDGFDDLMVPSPREIRFYRNLEGRVFEKMSLPDADRIHSSSGTSGSLSVGGRPAKGTIFWPHEIWDTTEKKTGIQTRETHDENKIRFDTGGMERMIIDDLGNVGIGSSTPGTKLEVDGTITGAGLVMNGQVSGSGFNNWDKTASDDLTDGTSFDGDVSGNYNNLQLKSNSVGQSEIVTNGVGSMEIAADAVTADEIAANAVGASEIAAGAVEASEIAADAVTADKIKTDAVGSSEIAPNSVGASELQSSGVTAGGYGDSYHVPHIQIDSDGRITFAGNTAIIINEVDPQVGTNTKDYLAEWDGSALVTSPIKCIKSVELPDNGSSYVLAQLPQKSWTAYYYKVSLMVRDTGNWGDVEASEWLVVGCTRSNPSALYASNATCLHRIKAGDIPDSSVHFTTTSNDFQIRVTNKCQYNAHIKAVVTAMMID